MLMMLPFEAPTVFEGIHKSYFRMPRVVRDQRQRFENDDLFRQLSHESAVKYTGFKDRPLEERQMKFITNCQEGHTEVSVLQSGNQFTLMFNPAANPAYNNEGCDFDKELGKVHIKAGFILNGVCVLWRGWIDLQRLEGFGCLEYDEYRAYLEDAMVKQQIDKQQLCNTSNGSSATNGLSAPMQLPPPPPPPVRLQHQPIGPPPPPMDHAAAAAAAVAAVTTNSMLPGAPPQLGLSGPPPPPPPVSLADSNSTAAAAAAAAAHYGNAAIAAAAAAAFHQALQVNGQSNGGHHQQPLQPHAQYSNAGAALAMGLHGMTQPASTLPYTQNSSPPTTIARKSPERENHTSKADTTTSKRQAIKRQHEDSQVIPQQQQQQDQMTQLAIIDEQNANDHLVDVVSDISTHDLELISSQRRMYKSSESIHHPHHHHHHQHHHPPHHKISRRA